MKIKYSALALMVFLISVFANGTNQYEYGISNESDTIAQTPPMGWNSYNAFGATVRESEVKENADFMAKNLSKLGWKYVVIDFCWSYPHHPKSNQDNPPQFRLPKDGSYVPWLAMDNYGRLLPDVGKFPSAEGGKGFKPLADYVHSMGLKFGIHVMRGIPRQAVWDKSPVKGMPGIDASMIADTNSTCGWLDNMFGLDMKKKGAQEYLNSLLELYVSWGVDFIKIDDMYGGGGESPYKYQEAEGYRKAVDQCGRPIVISFSPGLKFKHPEHISKTANMWRISGDFWDSWEQLYEMFDLAEIWTPYRKPGAWPDCDMLLLGRLSRRGPVGNERESNFTKDEQRTHVSLWSIAKSPLMYGGDLRVIDPFTLSLISNPEVLAINQKGSEARQLYRNDEIVVWVSEMKETGSWNVAIFNLNNHSKKVTFNFKDIGLKGKYEIRDVWQQKPMGKFRDKYEQEINSHGCTLINIK